MEVSVRWLAVSTLSSFFFCSMNAWMSDARLQVQVQALWLVWLTDRILSRWQNSHRERRSESRKWCAGLKHSYDVKIDSEMYYIYIYI